MNRLKWPLVVIASVVAVVTPSGDPLTLLVYAVPLMAVYAAGVAHGSRVRG